MSEPSIPRLPNRFSRRYRRPARGQPAVRQRQTLARKKPDASAGLSGSVMVGVLEQEDIPSFR